MSDPDPIDLSQLRMVPDWMKGDKKKSDLAKEYPSEDKGRPRDDRRGKGGGPRGKGGGQRGRGDGPRGKGGGQGGRDSYGDRNRGPRGPRDRNDKRGGRGGRDFKRGGGRGGQRDNRPKPPAPPKGITATLVPGDVGVKQIADQIKKTARAYPVFDIARLVLAGRDRYTIAYKREGADAAKLFLCKPDQSAWLSKSEAINHLPHSPAFKEFYSEETIEGDPPKGNYTSIAKCGFSGKLLGPPNHHSYQTTIVKLHKQRFSDMSIDRYKSRINIEHDEELVERWKTEQSVQHHYTYLKAAEGEDAPKFDSRDKAEQHFIDKHGEEFVATADEIAVRGDIGSRQLSPGLFNLLRDAAENTRKHPATLVQPLCGLLGAAGLKFFKRGRKIFAALTRPKPLSDDSTLSTRILAVVNYLRRTKRATVETLIEELAPSPKVAPEPKPEAAAKTDAPQPEEAPAPTEPEAATEAAEGEAPPASDEAAPQASDEAAEQAPESEAKADAGAPDEDVAASEEPPAPAEPEAAAATGDEEAAQASDEVTKQAPPADEAPSSETPPVEPSPQEADAAPSEDTPEKAEASEEAEKPAAPPLTETQIKVLQDLHWLLHEGAVIAFGDGHIELATPREPKPEKPKQPKKKKAKATPPPAAIPPASAVETKKESEAASAPPETAPAPQAEKEPEAAPTTPETAPAPQAEKEPEVAPTTPETESATEANKEPEAAPAAPEAEKEPEAAPASPDSTPAPTEKTAQDPPPASEDKTSDPAQDA